MGEKGYKAFKPGLICKDKQYQENTTFEEEWAEDICLPGMMHYCNNPFDCLNYYPLVNEDGKFSDFAEVKALGNIVRGDDKSATNKLHIGAKLGLKGFIKAAIDFTIEKTTFETSRTLEDISSNDEDSAQIGSSGYSAQIGSSGNSAQIGSSGDSAQIGSSGNYAKIGSSGNSAQIGSSGYSAKIGSSGYSAKIGSSGNSAQIGSSGYSAQIGSSGNYAQIGSSGNSAQIGSSGDSAKIDSTGKNSVIMAAGFKSIVKATIGSWITLAEYGRDKNGVLVPVCVKTEYVDGERIKENVFYTLRNKQFVEVKEAE